MSCSWQSTSSFFRCCFHGCWNYRSGWNEDDRATDCHSASYLSHHLPLTSFDVCRSKLPAIRTASLILKSRRPRPIILNGKRLKPNTLIYTPPRHIPIPQPLNSSKNLPRPLSSRHRTSQPPLGAIARERESPEHTSNLVDRRTERALDGSLWIPIPLRARESESAVAGNKDGLAGWDIGVLGNS